MSDAIQPAGPASFTEAAIFARTVETSGQLSPELAEHVLSLGISADDRNRVEVLLERNANNQLTDAEQVELENLNHVADLLSLWHSKARLVLKSS